MHLRPLEGVKGEFKLHHDHAVIVAEHEVAGIDPVQIAARNRSVRMNPYEQDML